jgi:hypothetical protein
MLSYYEGEGERRRCKVTNDDSIGIGQIGTVMIGERGGMVW